MSAAKAREQYQSALSLLAELQADDRDKQNALQKLFVLARLVHSIDRIPILDKESKLLWKERFTNLQDAVLPVVAQLLQSSGQSGEEFWRGCLDLLYAGVEACEQVETSKEDLSTQLDDLRARNQELERELQNQVAAKTDALKGAFELRTRLHVQQQDLFSQSRDAVEHLEALMKDRDELAAQKSQLAEECKVKSGILERQATAIAQLMDQCENDCKERDKALQVLKKVDEQNQTLDISLSQHSKVIENLIHINADLMDRANDYKRRVEKEAKKG